MLLKMEPSMKESGSMESVMVMVFRDGSMDHATKVIGAMVRQMAKESFIMQMVIFTRVIGLMTRPMDMEHTPMPMELSM